MTLSISLFPAGHLIGRSRLVRVKQETIGWRRSCVGSFVNDTHERTIVVKCWLVLIFRRFIYFVFVKQSLEEELNRRQCDIRQLTEAAGKLKEQQVLEYQALISSLTIRWQDLQRQFVDFQSKESSTFVSAEDSSCDSMGGPDFVTRVNKLHEAALLTA